MAKITSRESPGKGSAGGETLAVVEGVATVVGSLAMGVGAVLTSPFALPLAIATGIFTAGAGAWGISDSIDNLKEKKAKKARWKNKLAGEEAARNRRAKR